MGVGLWRSGRVSRVTALLIALPLIILIAPPLSPPTVRLGAALEAGFLLLLREGRVSASARGARREALPVRRTTRARAW
jgi:hypothetical protein